MLYQSVSNSIHANTSMFVIDQYGPVISANQYIGHTLMDNIVFPVVLRKMYR